MDITLDTSGGLLEGSASQVIDDFTKDATEAIAKEGEDIVRDFGQRSFKHSSGKWSRSITTMQRGDNALITTDIVYGPWLEGTGSRNHRSRFKGYQMFRRSVQKLEQQADVIAERVLPKYIDRLN